MPFSTPKGTRDFMPEDMILRKKVLSVIEETFKSFGFAPMDTPAFEDYEVYAVKGGGGQEIQGDIFRFTDKNNRTLGLRYDLTVPTARVVATNLQLQMPFKRYNMGPVWRYENPQKGRYREFWQCDVDVFGSDSMLADAECVACAVTALSNLGFKNFIVRINNRKVLDFLARSVAVPKDKMNTVFRAVDKLDKVGKEGVLKLFYEELDKKVALELMNSINIAGNPEAMIEKLKKQKVPANLLAEVKDLLSYLSFYNLNANFSFDLSLVRGLEYYTGPVFEISSTDVKIGSISGGGRYDDMLSLYGKRNIPAVGISLGIERIVDIMKEKKMIELTPSFTAVYVAPVDKKMADEAIRIAQSLRSVGLNVETDLSGKPLSKQFEYANKKRVAFVVVVGEKDIKEGKVTVKEMNSGKEEVVELAKLVERLGPTIII